jgi:hypothetical protein
MVDPAGDKLGTIDAIYLDDETGQPEWATVTSGMFIAKTAFVPLAQAQDTGDSVQVPYGKQQVKNAPGMEADGSLSQDDEAELYRHYGLDYCDHSSDSGLPGQPGRHRRASGRRGRAVRRQQGPGGRPAGVAQATLVKTALTGAVLVLNARMGEQQRPAQAMSGLLGRLQPRRSA